MLKAFLYIFTVLIMSSCIDSSFRTNALSAGSTDLSSGNEKSAGDESIPELDSSPSLTKDPQPSLLEEIAPNNQIDQSPQLPDDMSALLPKETPSTEDKNESEDPDKNEEIDEETNPPNKNNDVSLEPNTDSSNSLQLANENEIDLGKINFITDDSPLEYSHIPLNTLKQLSSTGLPQYRDNIIIFKPQGCPNQPKHILADRNYFMTASCKLHECAKTWFEFCGFQVDNDEHFSEFKVESNGLISIFERKHPGYNWVNKTKNEFFTVSYLSKNFQKESVKASKPKIRVKLIVNTSLPKASIELKKYFLNINTSPAQPVDQTLQNQLRPAMLSKLNALLEKLQNEFNNEIELVTHSNPLEFISVALNPDGSTQKVNDLIKLSSVRRHFEPGVVNIAIGMPTTAAQEAISVNNAQVAGFMSPYHSLIGSILWRHEVAHNLGAHHQPCKYTIDHTEGRLECSSFFSYGMRLAKFIPGYNATDDMSMIGDTSPFDWPTILENYTKYLYKGDRQKAQLRVDRLQASHAAYKEKFYSENLKYWKDYAYSLEWYYDHYYN